MPRLGPATLLAPLAFALFAGSAQAEGLALFPVKFFDTSHEAEDQSEDHRRRGLLMRDELIRVTQPTLSHLAVLPPAVVAQTCTPETVPCLIGLAKDSGADLALFVTVHKSSSLIMQIFVQLVDLESETMRFDRNLSFRGDTDESWIKAAGFLGRSITDQLKPEAAGH